MKKADQADKDRAHRLRRKRAKSRLTATEERWLLAYEKAHPPTRRRPLSTVAELEQKARSSSNGAVVGASGKLELDVEPDIEPMRTKPGAGVAPSVEPLPGVPPAPPAPDPVVVKPGESVTMEEGRQYVVELPGIPSAVPPAPPPATPSIAPQVLIDKQARASVLAAELSGGAAAAAAYMGMVRNLNEAAKALGSMMKYDDAYLAKLEELARLEFDFLGILSPRKVLIIAPGVLLGGNLVTAAIRKHEAKQQATIIAPAAAPARGATPPAPDDKDADRPANGQPAKVGPPEDLVKRMAEISPVPPAAQAA